MADQRSDDISVVGRDARIEGTLTSAGSLRIHGRLTGAITVEGEVSVAAGSEVRADINAQTISLAGRVKGNLTAIIIGIIVVSLLPLVYAFVKSKLEKKAAA